jgi:pre-mRNA-splicing factor 18
MGQVVTYFGESDSERLQRLLAIEAEGQGGDDDFAVTGGHETRNLFLDQDSRKQSNDIDDYDDDDDDDTPRKKKKASATDSSSAGAQQHKSQHQSTAATPTPSNPTTASTTTVIGAKAAAASLQAAEDVDDDEGSKQMDDHRLVMDYFKGLLRQWELQLNARPDEVKRTAQGKVETKRQKQCKDYIRPLFKLCKKKNVPPDILHNLKRMIDFAQQGEFVKANDAYIQTAIGNAAWPIGITLVGIHARSAHDHLQVGQVGQCCCCCCCCCSSSSSAASQHMS